MRFFQVVLSGAALISAALALEFNSVPTSVKAGETVTITYSPKQDATIVLRKGDPNDLSTLSTLGQGSNGEFKWTVPKDLANANDYAFEIQASGAEPNFSGQFSLSGGSASASASASASSSASASGSSSASASKSSSGSSSAAITSTTIKTTASASASLSVSSSAGSNSTISSATISRTSGSPSGTPSASGGSSPPNQTGAATLLGSSPAALIFGAVAAIAYL